MRQSVPKRRHIKFRRWEITQKKTYSCTRFMFIIQCSNLFRPYILLVFRELKFWSACTAYIWRIVIDDWQTKCIYIGNGPRKVARLPFCTSPCDILSGVSIYVYCVEFSCLLMQEATTFTIYYDGITFQHLAIISISVFPLCYGPGLLFRGPLCTI